MSQPPPRNRKILVHVSLSRRRLEFPAAVRRKISYGVLVDGGYGLCIAVVLWRRNVRRQAMSPGSP